MCCNTRTTNKTVWWSLPLGGHEKHFHQSTEIYRQLLSVLLKFNVIKTLKKVEILLPQSGAHWILDANLTTVTSTKLFRSAALVSGLCVFTARQRENHSNASNDSSMHLTINPYTVSNQQYIHMDRLYDPPTPIKNIHEKTTWSSSRHCHPIIVSVNIWFF